MFIGALGGGLGRVGGGVLHAGVVASFYNIVRIYCISPFPKHDVGGG